MKAAPHPEPPTDKELWRIFTAGYEAHGQLDGAHEAGARAIWNAASGAAPPSELVEAARQVVALYFGQHARSPGIPRPTVFDAMGNLRAELARLDGTPATSPVPFHP